MCQYRQAVVDEVERLVKDRKAFTVWNVTQELAKVGVPAKHFEVRQVVRDLARSGGMGTDYTTGLASLPNANPQPLVYFPNGYDPSSFTGAIADAALPTGTDDDDEDDDDEDDEDDDATATQAQPAKAASTPNQKVRELSKDGILYVPNKWARMLNLNGRKANVAVYDAGGGKVTLHITRHAPASGGIGVAHVDPKDNVRIYKRMLDANGISASSFKIELKGSEIVITPS